MLVAVGVLLVTGWWDEIVRGSSCRLVERLRGAPSDGGEDRQAEPRAGRAHARELPRWSWRQLTSMRTALVLLLLLALAAIPGSVVPQEDVDSLDVRSGARTHPDADAGLRPARAVRRLRLTVVRRDLPAADDLAGRAASCRDRRLLRGHCAPGHPRRRAT